MSRLLGKLNSTKSHPHPCKGKLICLGSVISWVPSGSWAIARPHTLCVSRVLFLMWLPPVRTDRRAFSFSFSLGEAFDRGTTNLWLLALRGRGEDAHDEFNLWGGPYHGLTSPWSPTLPVLWFGAKYPGFLGFSFFIVDGVCNREVLLGISRGLLIPNQCPIYGEPSIPLLLLKMLVWWDHLTWDLPS